VSHPLRTLVGCAALAAGLWAITPAPAADAPELTKDAYKRTADADLKFLQDRLADLVKKEATGAKLLDGQVKPALGVSLALSAYGDALGDAALKSDAVKVAEAIVKKDFKGADALAKKLAVKPGTPGKAGPLAKPFKDELMLAAVMSPFRGGSVGGLNIDKDIKDLTKSKDPTKIDPAAVEILGVRSAVLNAYGLHVPNDTAKVNDNNKKLWEKWSGESVDLSKQIAAEAGKGKSADEKKLKDMLGKLNARCTDCHNKFRDNE
jgi:hypothetical protein